MAEKREYAPRRTTPIGTLRYPHVNKADGKFNPDKPRYKSDIVLDADVAAPLIKAIREDEKFGLPAAIALRDEAAAKAKKAGKKFPATTEQLPFSEMVDPDTGDETGQVLVKIGGNDRFTKKDGTVVMIKVPFFSAKGVEIPEKQKPLVYGGSRVRVSYSHFPYFNAATNSYGVSLRLEAIKIIELKSGNSAGASGYGFGDEEEGYEAPAAGAMTGDESQTDGEASGDDEDF